MIKINDIFKSKNYGEFKIIEKIKPDLFKIQFINTGYITNTYFSTIKKGIIKDNLVPSVCNIGCLGYASKEENLIAYRKWYHMLNRCYNKNDKNYHQYGKKGVNVYERWLRFDYFLEDIKQIDGYDEDLFNDGLLEIDKDIKQFGLSNKIYSKETCCFVNPKNNKKYRNYSIQKSFIAIDPNNNFHYSKNIRKFCKEYNLTATHVSRCLRNLEKQHKGWKFKYIKGEKNK